MSNGTADVIIGDKMRLRMGMVKNLQNKPGMTSLLVRVTNIIQEGDDTKTMIVEAVNNE